MLQPMEWWTFDTFLRLRPAEPTDPYMLIVGIDESDISTIGTYPFPDAQLATLIEKLQTYQPRAIGLDIFRDLPVEPGHQQLVNLFQFSPNIIGIEKALPDARGKTIQPPPSLPAAQVGFIDLILDSDSALRRALVGTPTQSGDYKFSLPLLLAERYLLQEGFVLENGVQDTAAMRFGTTEFVRFHSNSGGYINADARGNQVLINYRSGKVPFHIVTFNQVMQGNVPKNWIHDHIVLIGMTATSVGDLKQTNAVNNSIFGSLGSIYGVEAHAHITSQMIHAVLQGRPWLTSWADSWEYIWIIGWGIVGISLGRFFMEPLKILLGLGFASLLLLEISFNALTVGCWVPIVPAFLVLLFNSAGLTASLFYRY
ncbi:MAG TPA: CHASE2 domain-containing protein, partial [Allocoleopsis sp.]